MDKTLFKSASSTPEPYDTVNKAGGKAYALTAKEALAQLVATGTFGQTYYADGKEQIDLMLAAAAQCEPEFVAKAAIYGRERGQMKDAPAFLVGYLSTVDPALMRAVFPRVIDNARMLRNFVQVIRSGRLGRKSLGTAPKAAVKQWLETRSPMQLFRDSVGNDPSIADCIKLAHPSFTKSQNTVFCYLDGRQHDFGDLPDPVRAFHELKDHESSAEWESDLLERCKGVPSRMLQGLPLSKAAWQHIARNARWMETRMNLNSWTKHGVFDDPEMIKLIAKRLADPEEVRGARAFPYQLLTAYQNVSDEVPFEIREALQDAMEVAVENVPIIAGKTYVCVDTSASMGQSVTGYRRGSTSKTSCIDVAALFAAALLRHNPTTVIVPFDTSVHAFRANPRDSIMTTAKTLSRFGGGGTAVGSAMAYVLKKGDADSVIFVSDNESWADHMFSWNRAQYQTLAVGWKELKSRRKSAKLVCIDLVPNTHTQAEKKTDALNVGGFSDAVFDVVASFLNGTDNFVSQVESVDL